VEEISQRANCNSDIMEATNIHIDENHADNERLSTPPSPETVTVIIKQREIQSSP